MASPIRLDRSTTGIVIHCKEHPWWWSFRFHQEDAWDSACAHEKRDHPGDRSQRKAREKRRERAKSSSVT